LLIYLMLGGIGSTLPKLLISFELIMLSVLCCRICA